jgi:hypothetical protein
MIKIRNILFVLLAFYVNNCYSEVGQDFDIFDLEYAIGSNENFEKLTTFNLRKLRESHSAFQATYQNTPSSSYSLNIYGSLINQATKIQLLNELKTSSNPIYKLRVCRKSVCIASSYTNLKNLLSSNNIQLNLTLHLNSNSNNINSITIKTDQLENKETIDETSYYLTINANLLTSKSSASPDTQTYIEKVKKEIESKTENAKENNKSFIAKYWYYIVPFVVIVFITSFLNPEQAGAGAA